MILQFLYKDFCFKIGGHRHLKMVKNKMFINNPVFQQRMIDEEKRQADAKVLDAVDDLFKDDETAQMVLTAWQEGYGPAGVRELWGLSQEDYDTVVRRIRRNLDRAGRDAPGYPAGCGAARQGQRQAP